MGGCPYFFYIYTISPYWMTTALEPAVRLESPQEEENRLQAGRNPAPVHDIMDSKGSKGKYPIICRIWVCVYIHQQVQDSLIIRIMGMGMSIMNVCKEKEEPHWSMYSLLQVLKIFEGYQCRKCLLGILCFPIDTWIRWSLKCQAQRAASAAQKVRLRFDVWLEMVDFCRAPFLGFWGSFNFHISVAKSRINLVKYLRRSTRNVFTFTLPGKIIQCFCGNWVPNQDYFPWGSCSTWNGTGVQAASDTIWLEHWSNYRGNDW